MQSPLPWRLPTRDIAVRLFLTCWLVYALHFATNIVREIYPAMAIGESLSFRVDEYANLHPDLFELEGYGWHIGNNPGASLVAAIPYAIARPVVDRLATRVSAQRAATGLTEPPEYDSPWPLARQFYAEAWRRGLDVKFFLAALLMQWFCMAPSSAMGVVGVFYALRYLVQSDGTALWLSLLYAFGTPVFFRTGFLNHNMMLGHIAFFGFLALWNAGANPRLSLGNRFVLAGLAGGTAVLFDYSGAIFLLSLLAYGVLQRLRAEGFADAVRHGGWYALGSCPPILLLWFYQWRSFGHPFFPGQHWMPPVEWIELGYQGYGFPQLDLLLALAFDYRFGLFVTCPILLLGVAYPFLRKRVGDQLATPELVFVLGTFLFLWVFFSGSNYTRLQFNTGLRYMAPILPFLFLPAAVVLNRLRPTTFYLVAAFSLLLSWPLAMYRDVESGFGMLNPVLRTLLGGVQLPILATVSQLPDQFASFIPHGTSALPLLGVTMALLYALWSPRLWGAQNPG